MMDLLSFDATYQIVIAMVVFSSIYYLVEFMRNR